MNKKRIGITGALGYIGSRVYWDLKNSGYNVIGLDNGLHPKARSLRGEVRSGDIRDEEAVKSLVDEVDVLIHLAALSDLSSCDKNADGCYKTNIEATTRIAYYCNKMETPLIFASSMATIGDPKKIPITASNERNPKNIYGRSKLVGEKVINDLVIDVPSVSLILSNVVGSHEIDGEKINRENVLTHFIESVKNGETIEVYSPGDQARDFISVRDTSKAFISALESVEHLKGNHSIAIGSGISTSVIELADLVTEVHGGDYEIIENPRGGETLNEDFRVDVKEGKKIGFEAEKSINEIIESF